ncbi:Non-specific lipid-transfer protein [Actinidia chinensis var. chinensis]|uniref:Non-specific lipid-transfer protein n=1 Tax=Actinidia chinensis var. chinensis TaxID=1590841 RepID=A0A2R6RRU4_ACTCC|nr:Non-specific lipid-transfer protein [Actinidia chinensis var. chinensis]
MASSRALKLASVVVLMVMVVTAPPPQAEAAVTCGMVASSVAPCLAYLRNGGQVPSACCNGVKGLYNAASSTADRQTACNCLKNASKNIPNINLGLAASLPKDCGVNIPYKISPSTDCTKVQ